jgi:phage terminase small subunit
MRRENMPTVIRKIYTEESEEELLDMTRDEVTEGMLDKEVLFCEYYIKSYNIKMACIKAGYKSSGAHVVGYKVRRKPLVNRYIAWLKLHISKKCQIDAIDIIEKYARIAFADVTDFVEFSGNKLKLNNSDLIDGQLIKQVKQGKDGITVELYDKLAALEKLERYFDCMPKDWKQRIEEKKVDLMEQKLDLERQKLGLKDDAIEDDGFIEALRSTASQVWEGEE